MNRLQYRILSIAMAVMLIGSMLLVGREAARYVTGEKLKVQEEQICVVIDAGHGGDDPGKVGINGVYEKDVNLKIAKLVKLFLEANDITVVMTRETTSPASQSSD